MKKLKNDDLILLEQICQLKQISLWKTVYEYLKTVYPKVKYTKDYVYAERDIPVALVAHLDTVFAEPPKNIYYDERKGVIWSPDGLGADDRAGVFAILKIVKHGLRPHIIFTTDEEKGGLGAAQLTTVEKTHPFKKLKYIIQLDRRGVNDCVFYDCDNKKFIKYIESFGFVEEIGSFSDISILCPAWKVAGVNLSIGYEDEHSFTETLHVNAMLATIKTVINMLRVADTAPSFKFIPAKWYEKFYYSNKKGGRKNVYDLLTYDDSPYDEFYYGDYGYSLLTDEVICDKCGGTFAEYETIPVERKDHSLKYICPDCLSIDEVGWCYICGEAYEIDYNDLESNLCYTCKRDIEKKHKKKDKEIVIDGTATGATDTAS